MLALALETSIRTASAALRLPSGAITQVELAGDAPRINDLMPRIQEMFQNGGADPRDLTHVFVGTGPGSYTGLRVGVSLALGLAIGPNPPKLFAVPSCDAVLWSQLQAGQSGVWLSDARNQTWYSCAAEVKNGGLLITSPAAIIQSAQLPARETRWITDDASQASLSELLPGANIEVTRAHAAHVMGLGQERLSQGLAPTAPAELAPLYLREFAAKVRAR